MRPNPDSAEKKGVLLVTIEIEAEWEDEFNRWYDEEHMPERAELPGFERARRFVAADGSPRYAALYELSSMTALKTPEYLALPRWSPWTERVREHFVSLERLELVEIPSHANSATGPVSPRSSPEHRACRS